jgi:cephalosporin hydroxylase
VNPRLSVIVVARNIPRELPRTIWSLSPSLQQEIDADDYEIIVVDNGSRIAFDEAICRERGGNIAFCRVPNPTLSPVAAANFGLARAKGKLIGVLSDGACLASPRLLRAALEAAKLHHRPVIATMNFQIGHAHKIPAPQALIREEELLKQVDWLCDPYSLFSISSLSPPSSGGWFAPIRESNALFLSAAHWRELGGYEEAFQEFAGGFANQDLWIRAASSPDSRIIMLLGEATFRQSHNSLDEDRGESPERVSGVPDGDVGGYPPAYWMEYERIRGKPYTTIETSSLYFGSLRRQVLPSLEFSAGWSRHRQGPWSGEQSSALVREVDKRPFRAGIGPAAMNMVYRNVMRTRYRGVPMLKSPFDIALYMQLWGRLRPKTVIEIGTKYGGSALWFADLMTAHGIMGRVISVDLQPPRSISDPRIEFIQGDAGALGKSLSDEFLRNLLHPLLIVEDSSHRFQDVLAVLEFFHRILTSGDYLVVEDGVVSQLFGGLAKFSDGPNRAVVQFLERYPESYEIDTELCDFYGHNVTLSPNGWLRRR